MDNKRNKVSVIIPVYNSSLLLKRSIDSVYNQETNSEIELIIIDDGSEDDINQIISLYSQIKFSTQKNSGPAAARNNGLDMVTGKYVSFLDADDYWKPGFLRKTIHFLDNNPNAVAVSTGQLHKIPGKPDAISPQILKEEPANFKTSIVLDNFYEFWAAHMHVCTGSVLMRTDVVKQTGGQQPELRITEDLEFWAYLATFGKWGFIPEILFVSDGGKLTRQIGWLNKNRIRWASAPSVEAWEKRIVKRIPDNLLNAYKLARGRIAKNLAYAMILSNRRHLARKTVINNKEYFPCNRASKMMKWASYNSLSWIVISFIIGIKERFRRI